MDEKKVSNEDILLKYELLAQEINRLKEENNSLKLKNRELEETSQSKKIESLEKINNGLLNVIESHKKTHA